MGMDTEHILWRQKYLYWDLNSAIIIEEAVPGTGEDFTVGTTFE